MYVYVVVCKDLTPIQQAVQACHASIEAGRDLVKCQSPYLVLAQVPNQYALIALSVELSKAGIAHRVFVEEDMANRPTALATEPISQERRKYLRHLPLYTLQEQGVPVSENAAQ